MPEKRLTFIKTRQKIKKQEAVRIRTASCFYTQTKGPIAISVG
jgi:hypothetical protein